MLTVFTHTDTKKDQK